MLRKTLNVYGILVIVSMFSGWAIPMLAIGPSVRLYDLMILISVFIFPILLYGKRFSYLMIAFYISLIYLYIKTCIFLLSLTLPTLVIVRYFEILACFLILPALVDFMQLINVTRAFWVAAVFNSTWVAIQVFLGVNFGLYGLSSFGHFGAAFSSGAIFASLIICLVNVFPIKIFARVIGFIILLGLIIGLLGVGSRTSVIAVIVYFFFSFITDYNSKSRWKFGAVILFLTPFIIFFMSSYAGTMGDNDVVARFANMSDSVSVRFVDREFPVSLWDAFLGTPEEKHFLGYGGGIGFNIDSVWFGALLNYGIAPFILVFILFSIIAFRKKMVPYYFMLIAAASGIDLLSTMQVLAVFIITYSLIIKSNTKKHLIYNNVKPVNSGLLDCE